MKTTLFYYSGTGNSLWTARQLAEELGDTKVVSIVSQQKENTPVQAEAVGLVFPVYMWGVPGRIVEFTSMLKAMGAQYVFAVAVNGGQVSNTLVQIKKLLAKQDLELSSGFSIEMPSNYIPWGGPGPEEKQQKLYSAAVEKIKSIAACVSAQKRRAPEKGPLWQRLIFSIVYKMAFPHVHGMDKKFWVDDKCNACGTCVKVCPSENVTLEEGKPAWHSKCEQCFACLQWCPQEAVQNGRKTPRYKRYHHPEIKLQDIIKKS